MGNCPLFLYRLIFTSVGESTRWQVMATSVRNGPQAPENNPPIEPQWFQPSVFPITAISFGTSTTVTTGTAFGVSNNYVVGQLVKFLIPPTYGAQQLNGQIGYVTSIPGANQVTVDINTSNNKLYNAFIPSPSYGPTPPQIIAIGDINSGSINSRIIPINSRPLNQTVEQQTFINGSFINISPQEP